MTGRSFFIFHFPLSAIRCCSALDRCCDDDRDADHDRDYSESAKQTARDAKVPFVIVAFPVHQQISEPDPAFDANSGAWLNTPPKTQ